MVHQDEVLGHRELSDHAVSHPLLGDVGQACSPHLARMQARHVDVVDVHPTGNDRSQSCHRLSQLPLPVSRDPRDPHDLSGTDPQAAVGDRLGSPVAVDTEPVDGQPNGSHLHRRSVGSQLDRATHHHVGKLLLGGRRRSRLAGDPPVAHHGDPVGQGQHIIQLVGDEDQAHAVGGHGPQRDEQLIHLDRGEDGRRLVQDQESAVPVEGLHDLHPLSLPHRQLPHVSRRIHREPVPGRQLADPLRNPTGVQQDAVVGQAKGHVLGDGQGGHQHEVLVDHRHPCPDGVGRRRDPARFPVQAHLARVGPVQPVQDLHERALAGSVLSQERVDLAGRDLQMDVVVGKHAGKPLGDPRQL